MKQDKQEIHGRIVDMVAAAVNRGGYIPGVASIDGPATGFPEWLQTMLDEYAELHVHESSQSDDLDTFQDRVNPWMMECFGPMIASDKKERNHRFVEESLELVQSCGCTKDEALKLVEYVFGREIGEPTQEVGGVMVTLAALCLAHSMDMHKCGETELTRIWTKIPQIREKQKSKPKNSPLPGDVDTHE